jgi:hypothetical protein
MNNKRGWEDEASSRAVNPWCRYFFAVPLDAAEPRWPDCASFGTTPANPTKPMLVSRSPLDRRKTLTGFRSLVALPRRLQHRRLTLFDSEHRSANRGSLQGPRGGPGSATRHSEALEARKGAQVRR